MKLFNNFLKLLLTAPFFFIACSNSSDCSMEGEPESAVSHEKARILYAGMENPLHVAVPGHCPDQVTAELSKGQIEQKAPGQFVATVSGKGQSKLTLKVEKEDGKQETIETLTYRVDSVPQPEPYFGDRQIGDVSIKKFKNVEKLTLQKPEGFPFPNEDYEITHFRWTYVPREGNMHEGHSQKARLPEKLKELIDESVPNDRIIFDHIDVKGPSGKRRLDLGINLTVEKEEGEG